LSTAIYFLDHGASEDDIRSLSRLIELYNQRIAEGGLPYMAPLSIGDIFVQSISRLFTDTRVYVRLSEALYRLPQEYLQEIAIADALHTGQHMEYTMDSQDIRSIIPAVRILFASVHSERRGSGLESVDRRLKMALARVLMGISKSYDIKEI